MNETLNTLKTRRSIRNFKSEMIPENILNQIIEAGTYAASGKNRQSAIIIAVTDQSVREQLVKENAKILNTNKDPFYNAPVILIVLANKDVPTYLYDGSLVLGNLMNAAWSLNIGSCWIHRAKEEFESAFGKELLKSLNIEGNYEGIGHLALGYIADEIPQPSKRKDNYVYFIK